TYAIVGGNTGGAFAIDAATGVLSVADASAVDLDTNATFSLDIQADDGTNAPTTSVTVNVTNAAPSTPIDADGATGGSVAENAANGTAVGITAAASDPGGGNVSYALTDDAGGRFQIDAITGVVSVADGTLLDFESATSHAITVQASDDDGGDSATTSFTIDVGDVNEAPTITSNGGGATAALNVTENQTAVTTVAADDPDGDALTYSLSGGADSGLFTIDANTGELAFASAPDFETPADDDGDGVYDVQVSVSDGSASDTQDIAVTVSDVNEAPTAADNTLTTDEDTDRVLAAADFAFSDQDGDALAAVRIDTLPAAGQLILDGTDVTAGQTIDVADIDAGQLIFAPAPDANGAGYASFTFTVSDGTLLSTSHTMTLDVTAVNDAPTITSAGSANVAENQTAVTTVAAGDVDGDTLTYSLSGGADSGLFTIDANTGELAFASAPDFEAPADDDGDGVYDVQVSVSDGSASDTQDIAVTVSDVNEAPTAADNTLTTDEDTDRVLAAVDFAFSDQDGDALAAVRIDTLPAAGQLTLDGTDVTAGQTIDVADIDAGQLIFAPAPDANGAGYASFTFTVSDGTLLSTSHTMTLDVTAVNDAPTITSAGSANVAENQTAVTTVAAGDVDGDTLTYSLSGGADAGLFTIDATSGELAFASAPDFEAPADDDGDGVYDVQVSVSDGSASDTQDIAVTVSDVNEAPTAADNTLTTDEDTDRVLAAADFAFSDQDGDALAAVRIDTLPAAGQLTLDGTDVTAGQTIDVADIDAGQLIFAPVPDANGAGYASFTFTVSDGTLLSTSHTMTLDVTAVNDAPTITSAGSANVAENQTAVTTVAAGDVDGDTLTYSLSGGADAGLFTIDANTGELAFASAPDFEAPADDDGDGVYDVRVSVSDGSASDTQDIAVTVSDVNEAPVIETNTGFSIRTGRTLTLTNAHLNEGDPDDDGAELTYTLNNLPIGGTLFLDGSELQLNDTFTQQDIDDELVTFRAGSTAGQVEFEITLADGGEDGVGTVSDTVTVDVTTTPPDPDPDPDPDPEPDLIDRINDARPDNLSDQVSRASQWLETLPDDIPLDVRSLTPTAGSEPDEPIAIVGSSDALEAFVIDATSLPSGSRLRLENIDFASIKGDIEVIGGAGDNVIVVDNSAHLMTSGDGDDTLYGGGGDDRLFGEADNDELFGAAGDDLLHGGSGRDTASFEGNRDDYLITQKHSVVTLARKGATDDTDTLVNAEVMRFADGEEAIDYSNSLEWITGLYAQVLGRQADLDGIQYWAQQHDEGMERAKIAMYFLTSEEAGYRISQSEETLDLLYSALLGRDADTEGRAYWADKLASGSSVEDIVGGFMGSEEMQGHDLEAVQWDFIA
ncbi:hypothetical protein FHR96_003295, partial [Halomonas organivorans]